MFFVLFYLSSFCLSGLFILDCPFGFSNVYYRLKRHILHILHIHLHCDLCMLATLNLVVSPVCKLQGTGLVTVSVASIVKIRAYCVSSDIDTLAGKLLITGG